MIGDSNDQSGTVGFLVGIIVLVFAGVAFSLVVDKRFKFSSGKASLEQDVQDQQRALERMKFRLEDVRERWKKKVQPFEGQDEELKATGALVRSTTRELVGLHERRRALEDGILAADKAFLAYREQYRAGVRLAAAGEELEELRARNGRTYTGVTITRVTPVGLEIKHSQGISRLRPEDLEEDWQERFQWHPEEHARPLVEPKEPETAVPVPTAGVGPASAGKLAAEAEAKKLADLRRDVTEARRFLDKAEAELARARTESRSSRGASVPGSLETWADKIQRLESTAEKFREQYADVRGRLAAVAPDDPLLAAPLR